MFPWGVGVLVRETFWRDVVEQLGGVRNAGTREFIQSGRRWVGAARKLG